jgi:hypothetical protein
MNFKIRYLYKWTWTNRLKGLLGEMTKNDELFNVRGSSIAVEGSLMVFFVSLCWLFGVFFVVFV